MEDEEEINIIVVDADDMHKEEDELDQDENLD